MKYEVLIVGCATREEAKRVLGKMIDNTPVFTGNLCFVREVGSSIVTSCTGAGKFSEINAEHLCALLNQEHDNG